ncbi:hypothetical protein FC27_GL001097 [Companilactobacillus versmoldensis DSM 14857 = KCTC 3814]|uniref:Uncharacterized protein n=2 Tax=Companilactobacillus versmoldensis TaxID=194326 RepID=A0A0R1SM88_9LACO|nr:hypothetical protein FC27_GL001097 [Companilactobacillus versmoldensis DSM 14857 = KCTC 3814]
MLPVLAYSTVEVVQAAAYNNADKYTDVDPSVPLKTSQRNPDNIVGLSMTEKKGVPIMRMNISPSNNDVIKKGDRLNISFNKKNVDTNKIKELASQDNSSLYDISKKGNKLVINFKKNATSGNYQEVFGIATKNVKASTKANATFAGKSIKIDNNNINSKYRAPQKQQRSNQTQRTSNNGNQQTTNNQGSQQAQTQSASSNDGQTQTSSSNGQAGQTQSSSQQQQQQATQQQTTQQQGQTTQQQTQNGTTQQQQANQSDSVTPSFSQAEDAVNDRTSIKVTGTATSDPTKDNQTDTSSNTNDAQTTQNDTNTNNSDQTAVSNNSETNSNSATTNTNNEDDQTESSSNVADNENNSSTAQTTTPTNNDVDTNSTDSSQATTNTNQTTANNSTQTTQPAVDQTEQQSTTTFEPQEVTTPSSTTSQTQASDNSGYIEIQNQGYVSPKDTLDNYLTSDHDLDNNNVQNNEDNYEDNSQFEAIYGHVQQKATNATDEELGEITKDLPSMWNYIGQNDSDSDTNGQVWNFHSTLSTGRDLFVTIDGTAQPDSSDVLQQQMPKLLRAMGQSIEPGALNEAVDIDALKRSQIYQDYLDGNYTGPTSDNTANTSDVINTVENHTTISLDKPTNGADITQLPTIGKVDPNVLLKDAEEQAKVNQNGTDTTTTDNSSDSADSQAEYNAIKQDTYNKMTPWASDDEKAEMLKSVPTIWNDAASKTDKNDKVGQFYNYVLNGSDGRQIYYTIDGRVIPNGNKYEKQLPNVIVSLGKDMKKGEFDQIVNNDILRNSQAYQDYQQQSQGNAATTAATTAATSAASPLGGLGLAPLLLGLPGLLLAPALLVPGLLLAPVATGAVLASLPVVALLAQPVILPALLALPALAIAPIALPAIGLGLPLLLGGKLLTLPIKLFNNIVLSTIGSVILTAPITIFNTIVGLTLGLINTLIGSIPLALLDFIAPIILNFVIISLMSQFVQLTTFNLLLLSTLAKALLNGAIDLALGLSFIGLPIALLKGAFDLFRLGLGLVNTLLLPVLAKIGTFLLLLPLGLLNTALLTMFNISIPLILGFITSLVLSTLVGSLTFLTLLVVKLLADLLKNGFKLLIGLVAAATIFLGLPVLIVGAQILNFFVLLIANAVGGLILWGLLTLAKSLMLAGLGIALFSLPLLGQFAINTIVKWSIRALIHIFRFFVGLFKVGARLVLSFVLGLLNAIAGIAKAASVITAVVSGIAAALTALIPVVGPVLALLPLLISLLSIANSLILTPIKLLLGFLNLVVLGLNLLAIPLYLFIRPLVSIGLALGAGLLSDILMPLLTLPLVLFNQLTLFNLIGLPLLLLGLFNTFVVLPLVLAAIGLAWAFGLPLILALGAFGLTAILGLLLLSSQLPIVALALLALPSLIPFFNLIMDTIFFAPLMILLASILNLFIGLPLMMLVDSIINLVIPFLVWLTAMLLLAPIFGPLAFLNPLTWINLPLLSAIGTFFTKLMLKLIALPITTFNFLALKFLNMLLPLLASVLVSLGLSLLVAGITFIALLVIHLFNKFLKLAARLVLLGAITLLILGALPILIGAAVLNFLLLAALNAFVGFNLWLITTLLNNLITAAFLLGLFLIPLVGQLVINTVVKWSIRAVIHLIRFFMGLFRLGTRLVLQFIIGLTNLVLGVAKGIAAAAAVVNLLLAPISLLVPVVGPLLFLLHLLRAGLAGINFLILLSLKFLAGLLNLLTLAGLLLSIPYWLFIRPLISELLALGAGVLSDIAMTLLTLPLVFFNQLTLFNLIGIPALLLKAFNNLVVLPLLINGIGLILAIGLPLALLLGALGLLNTLALGLLGLGFPLVALILLTLPGLIPFLNLNLAILNLIGLAGLILNGLKLLLLPLKILKDLINDFVLPLLIAGVSFLLLLPLLLIEGLVAGILNFLLSLIPALLGGLIRGLITLFFNGLPVFLFLQLFALLPAIITGLLTALIPGLNLLTIPLGLLALLALPLTVLGVINNVIQSLLQGLLASLLTQLFFNVITDLSLLALPLLFLLSPLLLVLATIALLVLSFLAIIIPAIILALLFLPIIALAMLALAPILLLLFLPLILLGLLLFIPFLIFGLLSSAVLVWFLAPIFLQIAVNPVADFVTFILLVWMMFEQPVLFWFFQFINTPLMFLSFIGMFVNWLNPLNWLFHIISIGALIGLPLTLLNDFLVLDFIKWSSLLTINFAAGLLAFITLSIAKLALINLNLLFIINTFLVTLPMIAYVWIVLVIGFVIVLATAILTIGINPIGIFEIWVMVPLFTAGAILLALSTMVIGLTLDVLMTLLQLPIIVGNLQFGLIMAALANPLATLIGINLLGTLGLTSLVLLFAGLFMLGQIWLPFTFGINSFLLYLVMGSPLFMTANFAGLVPVIGWIIELITDPLWMLIGIWGTALLTDNNFALFVHILIPLAFSAITGIMFLLALLPVALIILPLALIQSIAILGLLFGGVALAALLVIIPTVIFGILATATMLWFFAPILLQLLVNPIADFVAFVLLIFMMFEDPILFWWAFEYITVPMTLLTFIGMFVNWLNPLNYIFKAISALAILGIPALVLLALLSIDLLRLGSLLTINLFAGFPAFIFLTIAKWLMIGLGVLFFINTFVVTLPMIAYVWLVLLLGVVIIFVDALATLGINVPNIFTIWVMVPFFVIFAILIALTFIPVMLALDLADVLIALVPIVANLQLGLISAFLANPLVALLAANNFAILGISAIGLFLAGLFMLAHVWLPFTFGINSFILYFILGNPLWMLLQFAGLVPIIGWIVQIIVDIIWMALGLWGTALITDNNFALFIHIFVTLAFTTIPVMMLLLAVLPILLVVLPVGIIGSLIFFGLINLPILLFNLLLAIPVILYGVFSIGTLIWFLAPLLLQLAVNPIADFVAFQLLLYWAIENPIFFHVFKIITLPLMFFTFTGMFVNWLNPLNFLYHAINAFALLGIPVVALLTLLNLNLLRFHC